MDQAPQAQPPQPSVAARAKIVLLLVGGAIAVGLVAGVIVILLTAEPSTPPVERPSGFDAAPAPAPAAAAPASGGAALPAAAPSSLSMVGKIDAAAPAAGGGPGASAAPASAIERAAQGFREAIRSSEKTLSDLAHDYTRRYPAVQRYGRDWMSYPDLKKLNDDYMRDHDPIAFLRGLSSSPSFPKLAQKYAGDPAIRGFVQDCFTKAPSGAVGASMDYIAKDKTLDAFVQNAAGKVGLPAGLLTASLSAAKGDAPPDVSKIAEQALQSMQLPQGAPSAAPASPGGKR